MNPANAILKPEWHDCRVFGMSWTWVQRAFSYPAITDRDRDALWDCAQALAGARVLRYDPDQVDAVARAIAETSGAEDKLLAVWQRLPFSPLFLEPASTRGTDERGVRVRPACLVEGDEHEMFITPFIYADGRAEGGWMTVHRPEAEEFKIHGFTRVGEHTMNSPEVREHLRVAQGLVRCLLTLLQSANVDLAEPVISRQGRRQAARKGQRIPLEILVRRAQSYSRPRGGSREYSHAHDRAGNFAHHFEQTRDGRPNSWFERWEREAPERAIEIKGRRCYRIWRPPTVVGIGDGPYVPKVRDARGLTAA